MKNFYVITNQLKDPNCQMTNQIRQYLEEHDCSCFIQNNCVHSEEKNYKYTDASQIPDTVECVLVLGGDGTLLQASRDLMDTGLPLLGINLGTLGFLAEIEKTNVFHALDCLINDEYTIENRMMINGSVNQHNRTTMEDVALNDIVISRRGKLRVVSFNIYVDGTFLCSYNADGIIISTPTGSTGYCLSAGGPIVAPNASLLLLTAIAPHTLNSRSIVLPDDVEIMVELGGSHMEDTEGAEVTFDGDISVKLSVGSKVYITRANKEMRLMKINHTSFVEMLRLKMND